MIKAKDMPTENINEIKELYKKGLSIFAIMTKLFAVMTRTGNYLKISPSPSLPN